MTQRTLELDDTEYAAILLIVMEWMQENNDETHICSTEVLGVYHKLIKL